MGNKGGDHYYEATAGMGNATFVVVMLDICDQNKTNPESASSSFKHPKGCWRERFRPPVKDFMQTPNLCPKGANHNLYSGHRPLTFCGPKNTF